MTTLSIWDYAVVAAIVGAIGYFMPAYLSEKGKNLASKEDVEALTRKVEGVRTEYLAELERLRSELGRASLVHRAQYEAEFRVYEEIWRRVTEAQRAVATLRPMFDTGLGPEESIEARKSARLAKFAEAFNAMQAAIWMSKPFYSSTVHDELHELSRLFHEEAIDYQHRDPFGDDYWPGARKNAEAITTKMEAVCSAIRQRLSGTSGVDIQ